jgi:hypothetical protein
MVRRVYLYIAVAIHAATTSPSVVFGSLFDAMPRQETVVLANSFAPIDSVSRVFLRRLAAATLALAGRVWRLHDLAVFCVHLFRGWSSRVMTADKNLSFVGGVTTPAFAFNHAGSPSQGPAYNDIAEMSNTQGDV